MSGGLKTDDSATKTANGNKQITYYYNGIGTHESGISIPLLGSLITFMRKSINQTMAPAFGDARRILI